ncbi:ABC transporter substrate-binding protein [Pseudomonas aeruginosa]
MGTGPFVFTRHREGCPVRYAANPDYWKGKPAIDHPALAITLDPNVRAAPAPQRMPDRPDAQARRRRRVALVDPQTDVLEEAAMITSHAAINTRHEPFDDLRVRRRSPWVTTAVLPGRSSSAIRPVRPSALPADAARPRRQHPATGPTDLNGQGPAEGSRRHPDTPPEPLHQHRQRPRRQPGASGTTDPVRPVRHRHPGKHPASSRGGERPGAPRPANTT